ncbi:MAG: hypothetical protein AAGJ32_08115 [Pseudomonadota bacterium]
MLEARNRKLLVFGNGPSLRGFDFSRVGDVDTLGMNAAYRYWDTIDWYPDHYCCVDDQLIDTHHAEIRRLVETGQVKTVFTLAKILDHQPDMASMDGVYFREQFHGTLANALAERLEKSHPGQSQGKPFIQHAAFQPSDPRKLTTGAFAVRYGIFQGYTEIGLLGIDLEYVEILPEARRGDGLQLVIDKPIRENPNYFFDDYQREGDRYNVPNPSVHDGNLHVQAFDVLRDDLAIKGLSARVTNLNPESRLHDLGILPYERTARFLGQDGIGAIAVPTTVFEVDDICRNIALWDMPAYHPFLDKRDYGSADLVFIFSQAPGEDVKARILEAWDATTYLKAMFAGGKPKFLSVDLSEEDDTYQREYVQAHGAAGFKSGPNLQFFASMAALGDRYQDFVFYMETDCAPVRAGWLEALDQVAKGDTESWVIGSPYLGQSKIDKRFFMHLNGNALYRVGDPAFQAFLAGQWKPLLMDVIATRDPRTAYDCVLSREWSRADSHAQDDAWRSYQTYGRRFRASGSVINLSGAADLAGCEGNSIQDTLSRYREAVVVHGRQYTRSLYSLIGEKWVSPGTHKLTAIAEKPENSAAEFDPAAATNVLVLPESGTQKLGDDLYRMQVSDTETAQLFLIFDTRIDVEDVYTATVILNASTDCEITLSLCRHGSDAYEGIKENRSLSQGENTLMITKTFHDAHPRLRVGIGLEAGVVDLEFKDTALALRYSWWPVDLKLDSSV